MDYELSGSTAILRIDDGKANGVGHNFLDARALAVAGTLAELPPVYYAKNKLATRGETLAATQEFLDSMPG